MRKLHGVHVDYGASQAQGGVMVTGLSGEGVSPAALGTAASRRGAGPGPGPAKVVVPSLPIGTG